MPACPICKKSTSVRPSSPRSGDWRRRLFGKAAYRCKQCSYRFFTAPDSSFDQVEPDSSPPTNDRTPEELAAENAARIEAKVFDFRDFGGLPLDLEGAPLRDAPPITFDFKSLGKKAPPLTEQDLVHVVEDPKRAVVFDYKSLVAPTIHVDFEDDEEEEVEAFGLVSEQDGLNTSSVFEKVLASLWYGTSADWSWRGVLHSLPTRIFVAGCLTEVVEVLYGIVVNGVMTTERVSIGATLIDAAFSFVFAYIILRQRYIFGDRIKLEAFRLAVGLSLMEFFWDFTLGVLGIPIRWDVHPDWSFVSRYRLLLTLQAPVTFLATALATIMYQRSTFHKMLVIDAEARKKSIARKHNKL